jgi:internalin A
MSFVLEQTPEGVDLVVTGAWSDKARDALLAGRADGLDLNYARGFLERDLGFIKGLPLRRCTSWRERTAIWSRCMGSRGL